jgi:hypothetical protein
MRGPIGKRVLRATAASLAALGFAAFGLQEIAAAEPPPPRDWDLGLGLYGWLTASELTVEGNLRGSDEVTRHYDKNIGEAFEDWDGGGGGYAHFRYLRFVGLVDGAWVQNDGDSGMWLTDKIIDAKVGIRVLDLNRPFSSGTVAGGPRLHLDLLVGARYRDSEADLNDGTDLNIDQVRDWVDPVVGLRGGVELVPNLTLETVADVGGFDLGNASHLTWSVNPRLNYRAWEHLDLFLGWKHLHEDHDDALEIELSGPQAGIGYSF